MKIYGSLLLVILLFFLLLPGCGDSSSTACYSAPDGSTITLNPESTDVTDGSSTVRTHTDFFTISVKDADGNPLNKIKINIFYPWAVPSSVGVVQLYDNGVPVDSPFDTCTDMFGAYSLRYDYLGGGGLEYKGDMAVRSGTAFGTAELAVSAETTT